MGLSEPENRLLVTVKENASLTAIDVASGNIEAVATVGVPGTELPHEFALNADGSEALVTLYGNADYGRNDPGNRVAIVDLKSMECTGHIDLGLYRGPHSIVSANGLFWVTVEENSCLVAIDPVDKAIVRSVWTEVPSHYVVTNSDGSALYCGHKEYPFLSVVDPAMGKVVGKTDLPVGSQAIRVSPDDRRLFVGDFYRPLLHIVDCDTGQIAETVPLKAVPGWPFPTPDGDCVVVTTFDEPGGRGYVEIIDMGEVSKPVAVEVSGEPFHACAASERGKIYVAVGSGEIVTVDLEARRIVGDPISTGGVMPEMVRLLHAPTIAA